jgi:protein-disulfide isomerase
VAYFAAAVSVLLIGLQVFIGHFCVLCLVVDSCAIGLGVVAFFQGRPQSGEPDDLRLPTSAAWFVLAAVALGAPYVWSLVKPNPAIPSTIARLYQPGKINIVEFADYECPFCRALHPTLKKLMNERPDKVHFVRLNMPLPRHPNAMDAAKGAVCGEDQGKKEEMADALFESEDLTPRGVQRIAGTLHLDMPKFKECVASPSTTARIEREQQLLRDAGFQGLPTTYVGSVMIVGAQDEAVFREAMDDAARGQGGGGVPSWLYALAVAAVVGVTIGVGRER